MLKVLLMTIAFGLQLLPVAMAAEISNIRLVEVSPEKVELVIVGGYRAYQVLGRASPARLTIDLDGTQLVKKAPRSLISKGAVVSRVQAGDTEKGVRVVMYSADPEKFFDSRTEESNGTLTVTCTTARGQADVGPAVPVPALPGRVCKPGAETGPDGGEKKIVTYSGEKISLDFYKTDIHNVFRLFAEISGKNIIVDDRVSGELTLALKEVPWDLAMEIIMEAKNLVKEEKENIYIIRPKPEKTEGGEGVLVVRKFTEEAYDSAKQAQEEQTQRQKALDLVVEARGFDKRGQIQEALALYEKAFLYWKDNCELMKENVDVTKRVVYLYYSIGNVAKSRYYAGEALLLNPADAESALYAALSASRLGNTGDARLFFDIATKNGRPLIPEAFYDYALFLEERSLFDEALYMYQRYEDLFGPSLKTGLAIARLQEGQGKKAEACEKYQAIGHAGFSMDQTDTDLVNRKVQTLCSHGG